MALTDSLPFNLRALDALLLSVGVWTVYKLLQAWRSRAKTTKLPGPPAENWLFGVSRKIQTGDSGVLFEQWAKEYGPVFQVPGAFGKRRTVILDPKALTHFFNKQGFGYVNSPFGRKMLARLVSL